MNAKRAIELPMYGSARKCWLCGRKIETQKSSYHFFDFDTKNVKLKLFHTHKGCAIKAGLVQQGKKWAVSQPVFMRFWTRRCEIADAKGEKFAREYGMMEEPWPHTKGLSEQEATEWERLRAKVKIERS